MIWGRTTTEDAPGRHLEVEVTFDVDPSTPRPVWAEVGLSASAAEVRELDARYLDTADLSLARAGYALRRRTGGADQGWHLKGPRTGNARLELSWPLGDLTNDPDSVPDAIVRELTAVLAVPCRADMLRTLARIRNHRTAFNLTDTSGVVVAEFVDDQVNAHDERTGNTRSWREWEVELPPGIPETDGADILARATEAAIRVGARNAASTSKLARALGR